MKKILTGISAFLLIGAILGGCAILRYDQHQKRANEVKLQQNLWEMRRAIDFYSTDKNKAPKSLEELVANHYLPEIPIDPLTKSNKTWIIQNEAKSSEQSTELGIVDVHSGAPGADTRGKPYNQY